MIQALGGAGNIKQVEDCAETRLRLVLADPDKVDKSALEQSGAEAMMKVAERTFHLLVGLNADQYAAEMKAQLAGAG